eukprot:6209701-Pleurochrysis_carterae.AAC.4
MFTAYSVTTRTSTMHALSQDLSAPMAYCACGKTPPRSLCMNAAKRRVWGRSLSAETPHESPRDTPAQRQGAGTISYRYYSCKWRPRVSGVNACGGSSECGQSTTWAGNT